MRDASDQPVIVIESPSPQKGSKRARATSSSEAQSESELSDLPEDAPSPSTVYSVSVATPSDYSDDERPTKKRKSAGRKPPTDRSLAPTTGSNRCHQCRSVPASGIEVFHCTASRATTTSGKAMKVAKPCGLGFCARCLTNRYSETPEQDKLDEWTCPVCRDLCNCAACRRAHGLSATGALKGDEDASALAASTGPGAPKLRNAEAGPSKPVKPKKEAITKPEPVALELPDDSPALLDCLHLREVVYRFKDLMFDFGSRQKGSAAAKNALDSLSQDVVAIWAEEVVPRIVLRGMLRLLQKEALDRYSPMRRKMDRQRVSKAEQETHTQSRWGDRCWRTARPLVDGLPKEEESSDEEEEEGEKEEEGSDDDEEAGPSSSKGKEDTSAESMTISSYAGTSDEDEDEIDELEEEDMTTRMPSAVEKVRILNGLFAIFMRGIVIHKELQEGNDAATSARQEAAKVQKEAKEAKAALAKELTDAKAAFFGPDEIKAIEKRIDDQEYDARFESAKHYVASTLNKSRFGPYYVDTDGTEYWLPALHSSTLTAPEEDDLPLGLSYSVLVRRGETWTALHGASQIRKLADWFDLEAKRQAKAAKAAAAAEENGSDEKPVARISPAEVVAPLRAFAEYATWKLEVEDEERNRQRRYANRAPRGSKMGGLNFDDDGNISLE